MKVEYTAESEAEKKLMNMIYSDEKTKELPIERRVEFLERHAAKSVIANFLVKETLDEIRDDRDQDWNEVVDDIEKIKNQITIFLQTTLELEEYKVRLGNTESDLRQALSKISAIEQKMSALIIDLNAERESRKVLGELINDHADVLDEILGEEHE